MNSERGAIAIVGEYLAEILFRALFQRLRCDFRHFDEGESRGVGLGDLIRLGLDFNIGRTCGGQRLTSRNRQRRQQ